ncbi:sensor histidine kinase [Lysobacter sp. KIS68-7]|uniref:sensor histidine kinase n=1 Tax=Lysobacter sp. KIS68-7 TaxID=2904252 RepID=UPI001E5FCC28|nr:sensor histidine kinase [Lysobacter sp. KIS68-7]UHQ20051.1 sensor histidine kinase [Lysobacter sp. KIS68-7]
MTTGLADFIERNSDTIVDHAMVFARSVDVGTPLDEVALRDHLPDIVEAIVTDLRMPQTRAEEIEKSEGRALAALGAPRTAAGTHALFRAHSGFSISHLVSEYRALRASVLRLWADSPGAASASPEEVTRFNEAIDEAIAESVGHYAEEVERWRNVFLGVLGHDLRSPLSAILMTSELIARMAVDAPVATAAQRLIRSGRRMGELLDKLLVYNRAQLGVGFEIERTEVDLANGCREEIELLQASMPEARIEYRAEAAVQGKFDGPRVREALANLVVNASKYGARGGQIRVEVRDRGTDAEVVVGNVGAPISRDTLDLMFEPLRRGGVAQGETERLSLGLGLFIVSQIATAHGGSIRADSADGATTFTMVLPRD